MDWSTTVEDYYPVNPRPRWGYDLATQPQVARVLNQGMPLYLATLQRFAEHRELILSVDDYIQGEEVKPYWNNAWFSVLDAASLMCFFAIERPQRYIEIGSGFSTRFARHAIRQLSLNTKITSIDPEPRKAIDGLCDQVIRRGIEDCDLSVFDDLSAGDILFFDGSHRIFANSDVSVFFFEILPRVPPNVLIHVHDIFLPLDYPSSWNHRLYSEQYLLAAMLMCGRRPFDVILPNCFLYTQQKSFQLISELLSGKGEKGPSSVYYNNGSNTPGVSFWMRKLPEPF